MESQKSREVSPPLYYYDASEFDSLEASLEGAESSSGLRRRRKFLTESEERELTSSTDKKERRRIQNRVAQRAYRQKQKLRLQELEERLTHGRASASEHPGLPKLDLESLRTSGDMASTASWSNLAISYPIATTLNKRVPHSPSTTSPHSPLAKSPSPTATSTTPANFSSISTMLAVGYISPATAADLPTEVTPFITIPVIPIRIAILMNLEVLGLSLANYQPDSSRSPFLTGNFPNLSPQPLPPAVISAHLAVRAPDLVPTELQCRVDHHPYLDVLPFRGFRDRLLAVLLREGQDAVDQAELAGDVEKGLRVWGKCSWDRRGCEWTAAFVTKWAWLVDEEALEATNFWRVQRGEGKIEFGDEEK
ncbi:hypothetical protein EDC01DRAFT_727491 [Geopyxis carbonaria]|nr:hypothetical protein EDC01DRAFT_727491 [Geopyxis carbonaria]